jgi:hypothetical protein
MFILIDGLLPEGLGHCFPGCRVHTARWAGAKGLSGEDLIAFARERRYNVLVMDADELPTMLGPLGHRLTIVTVPGGLRSLHGRQELLEDLRAKVGNAPRGVVISAE